MAFSSVAQSILNFTLNSCAGAGVTKEFDAAADKAVARTSTSFFTSRSSKFLPPRLRLKAVPMTCRARHVAATNGGKHAGAFVP
jgi:hypothetical protein